MRARPSAARPSLRRMSSESRSPTSSRSSEPRRDSVASIWRARALHSSTCCARTLQTSSSSAWRWPGMEARSSSQRARRASSSRLLVPCASVAWARNASASAARLRSPDSTRLIKVRISSSRPAKAASRAFASTRAASMALAAAASARSRPARRSAASCCSRSCSCRPSNSPRSFCKPASRAEDSLESSSAASCCTISRTRGSALPTCARRPST
mmetsp:Transcript_11325/g.31854  ORF Transcript_11325/g.31854 Transcript_11325/m.31854 type:complete len:214 (+) Transcript_11325:159-800(+)